eukprot:TRINITY_DN44639_c0_g1_i1.p1 TRINITY_DN44639_c0_g1~~TRINITY_DN44639_c0_g1_i1.p1  ORF type:complete len:158 (+),score=32.66 TRINITY_DN44639_c0_g1_i1:107-580(+)
MATSTCDICGCRQCPEDRTRRTDECDCRPRRNSKDAASDRKKPRRPLAAAALGSIIASQQRTNARMDRDMFVAAEQEFRRVGGKGCVELKELADIADSMSAAAAVAAQQKREREEPSLRRDNIVYAGVDRKLRRRKSADCVASERKDRGGESDSSEK